MTGKLISWYRQHKRDLPWRNTTDPYKIWLSEVILQQTRIDQGLPYYEKFIKDFPTVKKLASAPEKKILKLWQGLGYYSRAINLHSAAKYIVKTYKGKFPKTYEEIRALKGIGDYTAAAISSFAYNLPYPVVDGNVLRFLSRYCGISTPVDSSAGKNEVRSVAEQLMEGYSPHEFNQAIMEFGALQCKPVNPDCINCPLHTSCSAFIHDAVGQLPVKSKKQKIRNRHFNYLVIRNGNSVYLNQRRSSDIWKNLYDFPLIESSKTIKPEQIFLQKDFKNIFKKSFTQIQKISPVYKHLLSHQTIYTRFYEINISDTRGIKIPQGWKKVTSKTEKNFALPKPVEKYLAAFNYNQTHI